jgi:hypothetical protein
MAEAVIFDHPAAGRRGLRRLRRGVFTNRSVSPHRDFLCQPDLYRKRGSLTAAD